MALPPVPTMSTLGLVRDVAGKLDRLMTYFLSTLQSQSYIYRDHVVSFPYMLEVYGGDLTALRNQVQANLENYLKSYFAASYAEVNTSDQNPNDHSASVTMYIYATVTEDGKEVSVGKSISVSGTTMTKYTNFSNTGAV